MRITETGPRLLVADVPRAVRGLGVVFVASGLFVLTLPFTLDEWSRVGPWVRTAVFSIGLAHLAGGLWTFLTAAATRTELDRATGVATHRVAHPWPGRATSPPTRFQLADVRSVEVVRSKDSDGDPVFQLRLWLAGSRGLWLQALPAAGESRAEERAARLRAFLGLGAPGDGRLDAGRGPGAPARARAADPPSR
jgi:hypothetical protein